jgi:hypothetical protein
MNLELETLDALEAPITNQEGIGITLIALGTGMLVGVGIVLLT